MRAGGSKTPARFLRKRFWIKATSQRFHNEWTQKYVVKDNQITEMAEYNIQIEPPG